LTIHWEPHSLLQGMTWLLPPASRVLASWEKELRDYSGKQDEGDVRWKRETQKDEIRGRFRAEIKLVLFLHWDSWEKI
jgi:hypothetical protein